jgi:NitT/TauT family transport system permease protein
VAVLLGGALWQLAATRAGPILLAGPVEVARALATDHARLATATLQTGLSATGGLVLAAVLGVTLAVAAWWSRALRAAVLPYTVLMQVVPIVAIAPLLVVWLGYGRGVAFTTAVLAAFHPVYSAMGTGLVSPARELVDLFALLRAGRGQELRLLRLPAALPSLFGGLRSAAGLSVIGAVVGEFVASNGQPPTLGHLVLSSARSARPDLCFAAITCAAALAIVQGVVLRALERRAIGRWYGS